MLGRLVVADIVRNPRRTLSTMVGIVLGVGLFCGVLFFVDGLSASMTQRAVAPLAIDMQRIVGERAGSTLMLAQRFEPDGVLARGQRTTVVLEIRNVGDVAANEVTLRSVPGPDLLVKGSATIDGAPVDGPPVDGDPAGGAPAGEATVETDGSPFARGPARAGRNLGVLAPGESHTIEYTLEAAGDVTLGDDVVRSTFSTRDAVTPVAANAPPPPTLHELAARIGALAGVSHALPLSFADLGSGTLSARSTAPGVPAGSRGDAPAQVAPGPAKVFGFDAAYAERDRTITLVSGAFTSDGAVISAELADELALSIGDTIAVALPDGSVAEWDVSGVVDLSRAQSLFGSRRGGDLETFVYTRHSVVVSAPMFADVVFPAFNRAATRGGDRLKTPPVREVDITLDRSLLDADPATAMAQTVEIADEVNALVDGDEVLLDNISNTLTVAAQDAEVAKRLFVFLGLPGALLAAMLAAYAGAVLAEAQRREQATLRIRGAARGHLLTMLALRTGILTLAGSVVGLGLGYAAAVVVLGRESLDRAGTPSLAFSAGIGSIVGFLATGTALYVTGRRSIDRQINDDRARLADDEPLWKRVRLDLIGLLVAGIVTIIAINSNAFDGASGSVYFGRAVRLDLWLLVLPLSVWIFGSLAGARVVGAALARTRPASSSDLGRPVPTLFRLSIGRRPWAITNGVVIVALIVSLAASLTAFTSSYDRAKESDSRFALGADIKVTPGPTARRTTVADEITRFTTAGIATATPVISGRNNVILKSARTSDPAELAAIDPLSFGSVAPLADGDFLSSTAADALAKLAEDPTGVLLSRNMATFLKADVGESLDVLLARATAQQVTVELRIVGLFERVPGFPAGVDALMSIDAHLAAVPTKTPDFYLLATERHDGTGLERALDELRSGPGSSDALQIDSRTSVLATDQSSLAALNVAGLVDLDSGFALAMCVVTIAIFVFGLLLQRRREYVTLRAQGVQAGSIRLLVAAEAGTVAVFGIVLGVVVGLGMGYYFVTVLRPLFVLAPTYTFPLTAASVPAVAVLAATFVTSIAASRLVHGLEPTELLRDE